MEKQFGQADPAVAKYVNDLLHPVDAALEEIRARAAAAGLPDIHVSPHDGRHLEVLTRALNAKQIVEIGTLAGYSGLCFLRGLPADGHLYTFEFSPEHAAVAKETFARNKVDSRVTITVGEAAKTLPSINDKAPFDLVFIDADKVGYGAYLDWAAEHLRVGGAVLADNTFAWGEIAFEPAEDSPHAGSVKALRRFNRVLAEHPRFRTTMLPTGEGLTLAVKLR